MHCFTIKQILRKHGQVLVSEPNTTGIDSLLNVLADLVRVATIDHVQRCPSVFRLGTRRGTHKQVKLHLALKIVGLHMVGERRWDHLGITDTGET